MNYSLTASEDDIYYVALYAVAVGYDNSFTNYYSNVLYLGSVPINAAEEDNWFCLTFFNYEMQRFLVVNCNLHL